MGHKGQHHPPQQGTFSRILLTFDILSRSSSFFSYFVIYKYEIVILTKNYWVGFQAAPRNAWRHLATEGIGPQAVWFSTEALNLLMFKRGIIKNFWIRTGEPDERKCALQMNKWRASTYAH